MKNIDKMKENIVNNIEMVLKQDMYRVILFGSYARKEQDEDSDIDIMIISSSDKESVRKYKSQIHKIASKLSLENDVEISMLIRDRKTYEESITVYPFYQNIEREGIRLYG